MARNKKNRSKRPKRSAPRRRRRNNSRRQTISGLLVNGARTLIGLLPGQSILKPLADFIFGNSGVAKNVSGQLQDMILYGVQAKVSLRPIDFVFNSSQLTYDSGHVLTNFSSCALDFAKVRAVPTGEIRTRSGMWAMALLPGKDKTYARPYELVLEMPGAVYGPAGKELVLSYRPTPHEVALYGLDNLIETRCTLFIAMSDPQGGGAITYAEFSCQIELFGRVRFNSRTAGATRIPKLEAQVSTHSFLCDGEHVNALEVGGTYCPLDMGVAVME